MKRNPDKEVFFLGSAVDDEDDAKEGDAGDDADDVDIRMMTTRNPYKVVFCVDSARQGGLLSGFCCG